MKAHFEAVRESLTNLAQAYYRAGQLGKALAIMEQAHTICDCEEIEAEILAKLRLSQAKLQAVGIFMANDSADATLQTLNRVREITQNNLLLARADDLAGLAHYYAQLGQGNADYSAAESLLNKVAEYDVQLPAEWESEWHFHRGLIYQNTNRIDESRTQFQRSYDIAQENDFKEVQSFAVRHLGFIQQYQEQNLDAARLSFEESAKLREDIGLKIYLPFSYQTLGSLCLLQEDYDAAARYLDRAQKSAVELNNQRALTLILLSFADLYQQQNFIEQARQSYLDAKSTAESIGFDRAITHIEQQLDALA